MARKLVVEIVGDTRALERSYRRSSEATRRFGRQVDQAGRGALVATGAFRSLGRSVAFASSAFLGGAGLIAVTNSAIQAASDLNEQQSKTEVVFGASAAAVEAWSKTSAQAFGQSERQALATASSFGALFAPLQIVGKESAKQSERLTELGADLASFYNTDVQSALDAIRSGLVGESEPLRKYGILLSETRVQQEALTETGKKNTKQLTAHDKVVARIALIYKDAAQAQGDFARTSGGLANQQRILQANIDNLKTSLGTVLLPIVKRIVTAFNDWLGTGSNRERLVQQLQSAVDTLGGALRTAYEWAKKISSVFGGWKTTLELAAGAWVGFKVAGITSATAILAANVAAAEGTAAAWRAALISTGWGALAVAAGAAAAYILTHWQKVKDFFEQLWLDLERGAYMAALKMVEPFSHLPSFLGGWARDAKESLKAGIQGITDDMARIGHDAGTAFAGGFGAGVRQEGAMVVPTGGYGPVGKGLPGASMIPGAAAPTMPRFKVPTKKVAPPTWLERFEQVLRRYRLSLSQAELTKTRRDDLRVLRKEEDAIRAQLKLHKGNIDLQEYLVDVQKQRLQLEEETNKKLKQRESIVTRFEPIRANAFIRSLGLNLSAAQIRRLRAGLVGIGPGMTTTGARTPAFAGAGAVVITGNVNVNGVQDLGGFADAVHKRAKARPPSRRGAR